MTLLKWVIVLFLAFVISLEYYKYKNRNIDQQSVVKSVPRTRNRFSPIVNKRINFVIKDRTKRIKRIEGRKFGNRNNNKVSEIAIAFPCFRRFPKSQPQQGDKLLCLQDCAFLL